MSSTVMANMFLPLSIIRKCVFPFHELHHHNWHVPASFDSQQVRISISWAAQSCLTCSFQLSASAYFHFIRSAVMADMFSPLSTLSECVFPFHEQHHHGWHIPATFDSQEVRISILFLFMAPSRLTCSATFTLSGCVFHFMSSAIWVKADFPP